MTPSSPTALVMILPLYSAVHLHRRCLFEVVKKCLLKLSRRSLKVFEARLEQRRRFGQTGVGVVMDTEEGVTHQIRQTGVGVVRSGIQKVGVAHNESNRRGDFD